MSDKKTIHYIATGKVSREFHSPDADPITALESWCAEFPDGAFEVVEIVETIDDTETSEQYDVFDYCEGCRRPYLIDSCLKPLEPDWCVYYGKEENVTFCPACNEGLKKGGSDD